MRPSRARPACSRRRPNQETLENRAIPTRGCAQAGIFPATRHPVTFFLRQRAGQGPIPEPAFCYAPAPDFIASKLLQRSVCNIREMGSASPASTERWAPYLQAWLSTQDKPACCLAEDEYVPDRNGSATRQHDRPGRDLQRPRPSLSARRADRPSRLPCLLTAQCAVGGAEGTMRLVRLRTRRRRRRACPSRAGVAAQASGAGGSLPPLCRLSPAFTR